MKKTLLNVIPMPKEVEGASADGSFSYVTVAVSSVSCPEFSQADFTLKELALKLHGVTLGSSEGGISLNYEDGLSEGEYRLEIDGEGARAFASEIHGAHNAASTLLQLMKPEEEKGAPLGGVTLPAVTVKDKPDCDFRAVMVDLARKWHPFETLLYYTDLCYFYKIKYLHLHFMDTQSYTLPSEVYPKLPTEGRHYTREQIAYLNEYAALRGVEIIPEIEIPGHSASMVNAYPELFANLEEGEESTDDYSLFNNNIKNNIICIGREGVMDSLRALISEVMEMFPTSRYFHIGGDEAAIGNWGGCKRCKRYMKERNIDGVRSLYTHVVKEVTDMVLSLGRTPIVWEGFPKEGTEGISRDVIVTAWESYYHLAPDLIEEGFKIINASWQPLYIVPWARWGKPWVAEDIMYWNIYNWQNWNKKSPAHLNPINIQPTDAVLGGELCVWECTYEQEIGEAREKLAALSERTWNIRRYLEDGEFRAKLDSLLPLARVLSPDE